MKVVKRNRELVDFSVDRISDALQKAGVTKERAIEIANKVEEYFMISEAASVKIDDIQDVVIRYLGHAGFEDVKERYLSYMLERNNVRKKGAALVEVLGTIVDDTNSELKDNANINAKGAMGRMLKIGAAASKTVFTHLMPKRFAKAHTSGAIHIHDLEFHDLTATCVQIDLRKLFENMFDTGHGSIRSPKRIGSYASLACVAVQANQNDQHGGQSIPHFDYYLAPGVVASFRQHFRDILANDLKVAEYTLHVDNSVCWDGEDLLFINKLELAEKENILNDSHFISLREKSRMDGSLFKDIVNSAYDKAFLQTDRDTYQTMEGAIHNFNTLHSRAGAQVPFSSINYGTDTSIAGRLVIKNILLALKAGMGRGETAIFPIHIFKVKLGVNFDKGSPNYDLFKLACSVAAFRPFPTFVNLDASFNLPYYQPGNIDTEVVSMGCRTRVIGNVHDPSREVVTGRGNLSFTSINLPRLAMLSEGHLDKFWVGLREMLELVRDQLLYRFDLLSKKKVENFPFLMGQGVWIDSEKLKPGDEVGEVLKHGTMSIGFIGLAETLVALFGKHHAESYDIQENGKEIIKFMRDFCDEESQKYRLNFSLLATPAEGLSGRFLEIDRERFGIRPGITDREYYTNSYHVPVYYPITMYEKILVEAPYHTLCNAGHITYVEVDGAIRNNPEAVEAIIRMMFDNDIGYGAINHPVDYDPVCGYTGVIEDTCPKCGRGESDVSFHRIRRVTGYLSGTIERVNSAKVAEFAERRKHDCEIADK